MKLMTTYQDGSREEADGSPAELAEFKRLRASVSVVAPVAARPPNQNGGHRPAGQRQADSWPTRILAVVRRDPSKTFSLEDLASALAVTDENQRAAMNSAAYRLATGDSPALDRPVHGHYRARTAA